MAYLRPPWFTAKIFNKAAMAFSDRWRRYVDRHEARHRGRQHIPVVVPEVEGVKYLVSTRGDWDWVRNVRADPKVRLGDIGFVATEVPVDRRAPIIAIYRPLAGKVGCERATGRSCLTTPSIQCSR